jgi:hypothetical protein
MQTNIFGNPGFFLDETFSILDKFKTKISPIESVYSDIGVPGTIGFGVGLCHPDLLPPGMNEIDGTTTKGHENYGNYEDATGSRMVYLPVFWSKSVSSTEIKVTSFTMTRLIAGANLLGHPSVSLSSVTNPQMLDIIERMVDAGVITEDDGAVAYAVHVERPYYGDLTWMTDAPAFVRDAITALGYSLERCFIGGNFYGVGASKDDDFLDETGQYLYDGIFVDKYMNSATYGPGLVTSKRGQLPLAITEGDGDSSFILSGGGAPITAMWLGANRAEESDGLLAVCTAFAKAALARLTLAHSEASGKLTNYNPRICSFNKNTVARIPAGPNYLLDDLSGEVCEIYDNTLTFGKMNRPEGLISISAGFLNTEETDVWVNKVHGKYLTGSCSDPAKSGHNGQECGVHDQNGPYQEFVTGFMTLGGDAYILPKDSLLPFVATADIADLYDIANYDALDISAIQALDPASETVQVYSSRHTFVRAPVDRNTLDYDFASLGFPVVADLIDVTSSNYLARCGAGSTLCIHNTITGSSFLTWGPPAQLFGNGLFCIGAIRTGDTVLAACETFQGIQNHTGFRCFRYPLYDINRVPGIVRA